MVIIKSVVKYGDFWCETSDWRFFFYLTVPRRLVLASEVTYGFHSTSGMSTWLSQSTPDSHVREHGKNEVARSLSTSAPRRWSVLSDVEHRYRLFPRLSHCLSKTRAKDPKSFSKRCCPIVAGCWHPVQAPGLGQWGRCRRAQARELPHLQPQLSTSGQRGPLLHSFCNPSGCPQP